MIAVTVSGQNCWLLPYGPSIGDKVQLTAGIPVDLQRSLTGNSLRQPHGTSLRLGFDWTKKMLAADFYALRNATLTAQDEPILAPFWPHAYRVGVDTPTISSGLTVAWTAGFATYAINPGSFAGYTYAAPLIFGRFKQPPRLAALNGEFITTEFMIDEDAPASYAIAAAGGILAADTMFSTASGFAAPIFPFTPDWNNPPKPGTAVVDVERATTGEGRQKATTFYPQLPEQTFEATLKLPTSADAARLLAWWARRRGITDPHWVILSQGVGRLTAPGPVAGDTQLHFRAPLVPLGSTTYVGLFDPSGRQELARVDLILSQQINLHAALANTWNSSWTTVAPAILARHTQTLLQLDYAVAGSGWMVNCKMAWREVAPEYTPPAGETRGTTLGALPGSAWFFQIDLDYNGAIQSTYLTNFESGATIGGHTWTYNACDFDQIVQSDDLEDDSGVFTMRWYAGCPFTNWLPGNLSARGYISISQADVDAAGNLSNFRSYLKCEINKPTNTGPIFQARMLGANAIFARNALRQVMSPSCYTQLFSSRCKLLLSDWTFNATIVSVAGNVVTIGTITRANGGGLPAGFAGVDWFALGDMGWISGGLPLGDGILTSAAIDGSGHVALTLTRAVAVSPGMAVIAVPGCDKLWGTCQNKFGNDNHRAFPDIPSISPSLVVPQRNTTTAKK